METSPGLENPVKMHEIKSEKLGHTFDEDSLKVWTEPRDVKKYLAVVKADKGLNLDDRESDEDFEDYSDGEINDAGTSSINGEEESLETKELSKNNKSLVETWLEVEKLAKQLCKNAKVSQKVANMCKYQCNECSKIIKGWYNLKAHFATKHGCKAISYFELINLVSESVCHKCMICSEHVLCDTLFLGRHFKTHDLLIGQYRSIFGCDTSRGKVDATFSNDVIGNMCVYECETCKRQFDNSRKFTRHLRAASHGDSSKSSLGLRKIVYHKCQVCSKLILCDNYLLDQHICQYHKLSVEKYCESKGIKIEGKEYIKLKQSYLNTLTISNVIENLCIFSCSICSQRYGSSASFRRHISKHKQKPCKPVEKCMVRSYSYKCDICSRLMLCDRQVICHHRRLVHGKKLGHEDKCQNQNISRIEYESLCNSFINSTPISNAVFNRSVVPVSQISIEEQTSKIGNLCIFQCPDCASKEFSSYFSLQTHYKRVHFQGIKYNFSLIKVARYHSCLICPKAVLSDRLLLGRHVNTCHQLKFSEYERTFVKNGGAVLPTYEKWLQTYRNTISDT